MAKRSKLWLTCEVCDYTWPQCDLPIDVTDMVKSIRKIKECPSCESKKGKIVLARESAIVAATNPKVLEDSYVVIYDTGPADTPVEEYYGYFSTPDEAKKMWTGFMEGYGENLPRRPRNPRLCKVVETLIPDHWREKDAA